MRQHQFRRVQREPPRQLRQFRSVQEIAAYRAAHVTHVHPDLMGAPGLQPQAHQGAVPHDLLHPIMRHRRAAFRAYLSPDAGCFHLGDRCVDHAALRLRHALHHRQIHPLKRLCVQLLLQKVLRMGRFCYHHQPAGTLVQPIHRAINEFLRAAHIRIYRVLQRVIRMSRAALAGQGRGLVDHHQVLIFIRDVQRKLIGPGLIHRLLPRPAHGHSLPGPQDGADRRGHAVHQDAIIPLGGFHSGIAYAHVPSKDVPQDAAVFLHNVVQFHHPEQYSPPAAPCPVRPGCGIIYAQGG